MLSSKNLVDSLLKIIKEGHINNEVLKAFVHLQSNHIKQTKKPEQSNSTSQQNISTEITPKNKKNKSGKATQQPEFDSLQFFNDALKKIHQNVIANGSSSQDKEFLSNMLNYFERLSDNSKSQSKLEFFMIDSNLFTGKDEEIIKLNAFLFKILKLNNSTIKGPKVSTFLEYYNDDQFTLVCEKVFESYLNYIKDSIKLPKKIDLKITDIHNKDKTKKELVTILGSSLLYIILQFCEKEKILVTDLFIKPDSKNILLVCNRILNQGKTFQFDLNNCGPITDNDADYQSVLNVVGVNEYI